MSEKLPTIESRNETEEGFVEYMGVRLPVAENRENAPKIESFTDYVEDAFSRDMERLIATSWALGEPILIEGGTSLGKTRTVKKMCAELGYEVYYQNLNNHTDPADLMGKYIPNPEQKSENDPRYIFADGSVTKALRSESGKVKVLILDEYNAAHPGVIIRLHEVLDAYKTGGEVTLTEDGNEVLQIECEEVKIIAITNPAGGGFADREPLDPAQIRRWTYLKLPDELPKDTFKSGVLALSGLGVTETPVKSEYEKHTPINREVIPREVLGTLPGMDEIVPQYLAFHEAAKNMVKAKRIANNQRQKFNFDDREEPRRVFAYIARFYSGDMGEVMREALRYFYAGKVLDQNDKAALEEMIKKVHYTPKVNPERRGLTEVRGSESVEQGQSPVDSTVARRAFTSKMREAFQKKIRVEGPVELKTHIAELINTTTSQVEAAFANVLFPPIPYSGAELDVIKQSGYTLSLQTKLSLTELVNKIHNQNLQTGDFGWASVPPPESGTPVVGG